LPVSLSGLGLRSATDLALPAFLASCHGVSRFYLPAVAFSSTSSYIGTQNSWMSLTCTISLGNFQQCTETTPEVKFDNMMSATQYAVGRARLLAVESPHRKIFECNPLLICMNTPWQFDSALLCVPHPCICGEDVDQHGVHGQSCWRPLVVIRDSAPSTIS